MPSICRLRPDLPQEADLFMQKSLAKKPDDRYPTPQDFIAALDKLLERLQVGGNGRTPGPVPAPPSPKEWRLVAVSSGREHTLRGDLLVVGRQDPQLHIYPDIDLEHKTVGRRHAYLRKQQGTYTVEDLNALNKTRLNGETLEPHEEHKLKDGDILRFGNVEVRFELR
ncbi:FHA domain-containing protein [Ktedonospora formicarum]|uniref:FHA domain-containing protein n=1 Tax=Ktedonospora formicarum TaxID=2778364 RepID=A0A8J3MSK4_9CHLR|nr:FHA domain-containing protein [Ktedonospora formicarum]GHO44966.1 hypothetical protein KSX_31290 [Ktedonospora formicarum]